MATAPTTPNPPLAALWPGAVGVVLIATGGWALERTLWAGASAVLLGAGTLWWAARRVWRGRAEALVTGEVARAKLLRSNAELARSVQRTEAARARLRVIVDTLGDGLGAVTPDGLLELANPALAPLLGLEGTPVGEPLAPRAPEALSALLQGVARSGMGSEVGFRVGEGMRHAVVSPLPAEEGAAPEGASGVVLLVRDVTLEHELDRMKSSFTATVSHEMRTPLTSILGFTKLIGGQLERSVWPALPPDHTKANKARRTIDGNLAIVTEEGARLMQLIDDVLDLSRMESGQMSWTLADHAPQALATRAAEAVQARFDLRSDLALAVVVDPALPAVHTDAERIHQVLLHLLGNAEKFTTTGTVTLAAERVDDEVHFAVTDTGVGLAAEDRARVFERFVQVGDTLTDRPTGTGLGLPICRQILSHLGGRIWAEGAAPGGGARFVFTLPVAATTA